MSELKTIDAQLTEHNPFAQPPFVVANNIWGKGFPDVESLNSHASDAVFKALKDIQSQLYPCASILITAQDGTGKSHLISRIRRKLQDTGSAFFILANKFSDLNQSKPGFQKLLAESLSNIGSEGVTQWQQLATAMANLVITSAKPDAKSFEPKDLVKKFESIENAQQISDWVIKLAKAFCKIKPVKDPEVVKAVFWTLSDSEAPFASNWLGGKELAQYKANELHLPVQNQSFETILQILELISEYNSLIICFDELDSAEFNDFGLRKAQIVTNLVKELIENIDKGIILSVMMPGTWNEEVRKKMPASVSAKASTFSDPIDLQYLDADTIIELVHCFLKDYYDSRELVPPHALYPFKEAELRAIGKGKPTVREALQWCAKNCQPSEGLSNPINPKPINLVESAFQVEMGEDIKNQLDENYFIANVLSESFQDLVGETIEGVKICRVLSNVINNSKKDNYLNFKIIGLESDSEVRIGVAVLQYDGGRALGAGFKRLLDESHSFNLTRGCLVRSKDKPMNQYFTVNYLEPLIKKGGEFVNLLENQIKPLIAIQSVYLKKGSDYNLTDEQIEEFVREFGQQYSLGAYNPLIQEILSNPSYAMPEGLKEEPAVLHEDSSGQEIDNDEVPTELLEA